MIYLLKCAFSKKHRIKVLDLQPWFKFLVKISEAEFSLNPTQGGGSRRFVHLLQHSHTHALAGSLRVDRSRNVLMQNILTKQMQFL